MKIKNKIILTCLLCSKRCTVHSNLMIQSISASRIKDVWFVVFFGKKVLARAISQAAVLSVTELSLFYTIKNTKTTAIALQVLIAWWHVECPRAFLSSALIFLPRFPSPARALEEPWVTCWFCSHWNKNRSPSISQTNSLIKCRFEDNKFLESLCSVLHKKKSHHSPGLWQKAPNQNQIII